MASSATAMNADATIGAPSEDPWGGVVSGVVRRLVGGAMAVTVAGGVTVVATVLIGLLLARALDSASYGRTNVLLNEFLILTLVSGFGLTVGATSAAARLELDEGLRDWGVLHVLRLVTLVLPLGVGAIWSIVQGDPLHVVVGLAVCAFMLQDFYVGSLQGTSRFDAASCIVAFQPMLFAGTVGLALVTDQASPALVLFSLLGSHLVSATLAGWLVAGHQERFLPGQRFAWLQAWRQICLNMTFQVITFLQYGFVSLPIVIVGNVGHYTEAALLSVVLTLVRLVLVLLGPLLTGFYFALACKLVTHGERVRLQNLFGLTARLATLAGLACAIGLAAFPVTAIGTLYGVNYLGASSLLLVMVPLAPILALDAVLTWTLIAEHRAGTVVVALGLRLLIGLGAALGAVYSEEPRLDVLGIGYGIASVVGLVVQLYVVGLTIAARTYLPRLAAALAVAVLSIGIARAGLGPDGATLLQAVAVVTVASLAMGVVVLVDLRSIALILAAIQRRLGG